ncbi:MAG TPA: hypothetical protein ENN03_06075 [bacterium]|nr:hypothetical protein [bacterium]
MGFYFREVQRFRQIWGWLIVLSIAALMWYMAFQQLILGLPPGNNPAPDSLLVALWLIIGIGMPVFMGSCRLITEVREDGLYVRFAPFHRNFHRYGFDEIAEYELRTFRPVLHYGGWGIRYGSRGMAYTMSGKRGVQLVLKSGKNLLIGSRRADELRRAMDNLFRS